MNYKNLFKFASCLLVALMLSFFCFATAFAVGEDEPFEPTDEPYVENTTEYVEPEPEPTDPPNVEETTEYVEPETTEPVTEQETSEYTEPVETQTEPELTNPPEHGGYVEPEQQPTTEFIPPTLPKTVSDKAYKTSYTAGLVSWVCVGVGLLTIFIVATSTKLGARKAKRG